MADVGQHLPALRPDQVGICDSGMKACTARSSPWRDIRPAQASSFDGPSGRAHGRFERRRTARSWVGWLDGALAQPGTSCMALRSPHHQVGQ